MHYRNEIIIPNTENVELAVSQVMEPFNENSDDLSGNEFWDFYVIGGRFSGSKMEESLGDKIDVFRAKLNEIGVTVSGLQFGKPELSPASQVPMVDNLWAEHFPDIGGPCPLFQHSNNQYKSDSLLPNDVAEFSQIEPTMSCERIIIAGPAYSGEGFQAEFMVQRDFWTGCNHLKTEWDGTLSHCISMFNEYASRMAEAYRDRVTIKESHLVVTVDTHS